MAVTVSRFKKAFPEFEKTQETLCLQKLDAAGRRIAATIWGDKAADGQMLLAAHLLAISPQGEKLRFNKKQIDAYMLEWQQMKREVTMGAGRIA
jgi:hypothetical protein